MICWYLTFPSHCQLCNNCITSNHTHRRNFTALSHGFVWLLLWCCGTRYAIPFTDVTQHFSGDSSVLRPFLLSTSDTGSLAETATSVSVNVSTCQTNQCLSYSEVILTLLAAVMTKHNSAILASQLEICEVVSKDREHCAVNSNVIWLVGKDIYMVNYK